MAADVLATQVARASAAMILTSLSWNISSLTPDKLDNATSLNHKRQNTFIFSKWQFKLWLLIFTSAEVQQNIYFESSLLMTDFPIYFAWHFTAVCILPTLSRQPGCHKVTHYINAYLGAKMAPIISQPTPGWTPLNWPMDQTMENKNLL